VKSPNYLFWVGCAGAYDDSYKKVTAAFAKILSSLEVNYAVLGKEESCTGDPARRAGNEMLYQMQALQNIEIFKAYEVQKIITICPHCYNIFKNEYPDLGGNYEVISYVDFLGWPDFRGKTAKLTRKCLQMLPSPTTIPVTWAGPTIYTNRRAGCLIPLQGKWLKCTATKALHFAVEPAAGKCLRKPKKGIRRCLSNALKTP
jgi:hypothetical protein